MVAPTQPISRHERLRDLGPYVEWSAQRDGHWLVARQPHAERSDGTALLQRLEVAAAQLEDLQHPHLLRCLELAALDDGPAQLLEAAAGCPLDQLEGPPLRLRLLVLHDVLLCLGFTHARDLCHGALSPAHIHLGLDGQVRVDFGLAPGAYGEAGSDTLTEHVDLRYARPDWLAADHGLSPRLDIYAAITLCLPEPGEAPAGLASHLEAARIDGERSAAELAAVVRAELHDDSRQELNQWLAAQLDLQEPETEPPDVKKIPGAFTRMLAAQKSPVEPKPLLLDPAEAPVGTTDPTVAPDEGMLAVGAPPLAEGVTSDPPLPASKSSESQPSSQPSPGGRRGRGLAAFAAGFLVFLLFNWWAR